MFLRRKRVLEKKKGRLSDVVWTKIWKCETRAASGGFQTLEHRLHASFAVGGVKSCFLSFPILSLLGPTSCYFLHQLLLLLCFSPLPSKDRWYKSFDNSPPSSKGGCLCGASTEWSLCPRHSLYAPITHFILLAESGRSRGDPVEAFNSMLSHVLWRCLTETSPLPGQPFCFWGFTPKKGRGEESTLLPLPLQEPGISDHAFCVLWTQNRSSDILVSLPRF